MAAMRLGEGLRETFVKRRNDGAPTKGRVFQDSRQTSWIRWRVVPAFRLILPASDPYANLAVSATTVCRPKRVQSHTNRYPGCRCPYSFPVVVLLKSEALSRLLALPDCEAFSHWINPGQTPGGCLSTPAVVPEWDRRGKGVGPCLKRTRQMKDFDAYRIPKLTREGCTHQLGCRCDPPYWLRPASTAEEARWHLPKQVLPDPEGRTE